MLVYIIGSLGFRPIIYYLYCTYYSAYIKAISCTLLFTEYIIQSYSAHCQSLISLSLSPYSQHGIRAIFLWFSLGKIRRSSAFTGSRSLPQDRKLRESYNALVDGLISFPLNIPGTTFHTCLQVLYYILTITLMIGEKQIQDQIFFLGLTNNFFKVL